MGTVSGFSIALAERSLPVTLQAGDDLADMSLIDDDGEHRHSESAPGQAITSNRGP
jgi:hypothetical protein